MPVPIVPIESSAALVVLGGRLITRFAPLAKPDHSLRLGNTLRSARSLLGHRPFLEGTIASTTSYALIILAMRATPLTLTEDHGHLIGTTAAVMRNHYLGMFVPCLFSGGLLEALGTTWVACRGRHLRTLPRCPVRLVGLSAFHVALTLLGTGRNFAFPSGTKRMFSSASSGQGAVPQAVNDCAVYSPNFAATILVGGAILVMEEGWRWGADRALCARAQHPATRLRSMIAA